MNISIRQSLPWVVLACFCALGPEAYPQDLDVNASGHGVEVHVRDHRVSGDNNNDNGIVKFGGNSTLAEGKSAESVVSVFGSSTSAGNVSDSVVSVGGSSRVTGPVGDSVVAVAGGVYVNSKVGGDVVAVLGDVELGPAADVGGDVTAVGGVIKRDPAAIVHGQIQNVLAELPGSFSWLKTWVMHCLFYGRPLALVPGLGWAWGLALGFLALYVLIALLFRGPIDRCVKTLETQPSQSLLAALITLLLIPVVFIILCITIIGIAALPFLMLGLFCAGLFGRTIVLATLGRRVTGVSAATANQTPLAVLVGGVIVLGLYLVPVLGFLIYMLLGIIGLGVVIYTLVLAARASSAERIATPATGAASAANVAPEAAPSQPSTINTASAATPDHSGPPLGESSPASTAGATASGALASNVLDASVLPRAGFWARMGALLIDAMLVGIVLGGLWHHSSGLELPALATYGAVMWKIRGTTIGGIVFHLKVVRVDGRPVDWATSIVRALSCFLSLVIVFLGFLWIVFDDNKQAWHDKIAGTIVVRVPKGVSLV
jgi:uncharacterized RDD family membrane protein YckC